MNWKLFLIITIVLGLLVRFQNFHLLPIDGHAMRQTDTESVAYNLAFRNHNILYPQNSLIRPITNTNSYFFLEFPAYQYSISLLYRLFGWHIELARILNLFLFVVSVLSLFLFTKNTFLEWDGANLITVSDTIGCVSHETIQNIGSWTIWLHTTGVWAYNDNTGQLQLLSRAIDPYIKAINQTNFPKASAVAVGRVYKVAVGELLPLESVTTSTSTSSTSTSSTSSSTSSTSTSSTSTSTSSFTTITTSTSSTSVSTTSSSTSSTSTSTTTAVSTKKVYRLCYDFDLNAWWTEEHKREFRFQFNHTMHGYTKPYFTDELGNLFRDETTNRDHIDPIPMEVQLGRNNFGTDQTKRYLSVLVDSENARGAQLQYSIDGGAFRTLGQVNKNVEKLLFPTGGEIIEGRDIDFKFVHNETGDPGVWNGITTWWTLAEVSVNG